jgi:hypothetical protein
MHLTLEEWDDQVGKHLRMIEAAAEICERHSRLLMGMPDWDTKAAEALWEAENIMGRALTRIAKVRHDMAGKEHVS